MAEIDLVGALGAQAAPGWKDLGAALAGGGGTPGQMPAYMRGQKDRASLDELLARAQIKQQEAMQREKFRETLASSGLVPPEQIDLVSAATLGGVGSDFSSSMSGLQTGAETGLLGEAATAARAGEVDLLNALGAARTGNPLERTTMSGGVAYDPYAAPDAQNVVVTPVGQAEIEADQARAWRSRQPGASSDKPPRDYVGEGIIERELANVDASTERELSRARTAEQRQAVLNKRRKGYQEVRARYGQTQVAAPSETAQQAGGRLYGPDLTTILSNIAMDRRERGRPPLTGDDARAIRKQHAAGVPVIDPVDLATRDASDASRKAAGVQAPADSINVPGGPTRDGTRPPQVVDLAAAMSGETDPMSYDVYGRANPADGVLRDETGASVDLRPEVKSKPKPAAKAKPPMKGARQAKDGNWYIPDPSRPGKYLRVDG